MGRFAGWVAAPFLSVAILAFGAELARSLWGRWAGPAVLFQPALLAFTGGILFRFLFRRVLLRIGREDPLEFIDTLEHELTHALVGYLTFSPPVSLSADLRGGGEVQLKGSNPLAALAPYYLPLWCLIAVGLGLLIRASTQEAWNILVFVLLGAFAYRLSREYRWRQTDLHVYGFTFSTLATAFLLLLVLGLVLEARDILDWTWMARAMPESWNILERAIAAAIGVFRKS